MSTDFIKTGGMYVVKNYVLAHSVSDALTALKAHNGQARIIAGGTDLVLDIADGKIETNYLIDITRVPELAVLESSNGIITVGAAVTHNQAAKSPLLRHKALVLAQAAQSVGSLQIRNVGTLAGNIVRAQPGADTAVALVALDAKAEITSVDGTQLIPVNQLYAGVGQSTVDSTLQLVTSIKFPELQSNQGSAFERLAKRRSLSLPMLNVAAVVSIIDNKFEWVRIAMAPVGIGPIRATRTEDALKGMPITTDYIVKAAQLTIEQANPRSSALRGSRGYRLQVLPILVRRAIEAAVNNAMAKNNK